MTTSQLKSRRRAIAPEDKTERRAVIVRAATELVRRDPSCSCSVDQLAAKAGVAKGTVYLYFGSREEVLLAVHEKQSHELFDVVERALNAPQPSGKSVVRAGLEYVRATPQFYPLAAGCRSMLDSNVSTEVALAFKLGIAKRLQTLGARIEAALPRPQGGRGRGAAHQLLRADHRAVAAGRPAAVAAPGDGPARDAHLQDRFREAAQRRAARPLGSGCEESEMSKLWILATVLLVACTQAAEKAVEEVRPVRVLKIGVADSTRRVEYAGEVRARYETRLAFRVTGKITERLVDTGATVRRGQPVARIDAADLTLAVTSAKAQVASLEAETTLADAEYKRYRDLREKNFISQAEFDRRANTLVHRAVEARRGARAGAPGGQPGRLHHAASPKPPASSPRSRPRPARWSPPARPWRRLAQPGEKEIVFSVPESQIEFVQHSPTFSVSLNARPGKTWQGRLRELSPAADPATRTYAARVTILGAGDDVDLGMSARAAVEAAPGQAKRIEIPIAALHSRGESAQVYLVEGGTVRSQAVKTAGVSGERVVVESGLKAGDMVVAAGANLLRPGQRVRVLNEK